jgi:peptidoglycan/LPS O-acetylase OafA/YrhL
MRGGATGPASSVGRRLPEIEGLRGLIAALVVLHHSLIVLPAFYDGARTHDLTTLNVLKYSPLGVFLPGAETVLFFYLISGFVLAIPFVDGRAPGFFHFVVKRVTRIWPAYAAACVLAFVTAAAVGGSAIPSLRDWPGAAWRSPVTAPAILQHLSLVTDFPTRGFDPVLWSLIHEMRVSLVFPFLAALVLWQRRWWLTLAASIAVAYTAIHLLPPRPGTGAWLLTAVYLQFFVSGILLARHRSAVIARIRAAGTLPRLALAAGSLLLYTHPWWMPRIGHAHTPFFDMECVLAGTVGLLVSALGSPRAGAALCTRPLQYLGRISYSLYLVHAIVLLALLHLFYGRLPVAVLLIALWPLSLGLAALGERYIEQPSIALGRRLTRRSPAVVGPGLGLQAAGAHDTP